MPRDRKLYKRVPIDEALDILHKAKWRGGEIEYFELQIGYEKSMYHTVCHKKDKVPNE